MHGLIQPHGGELVNRLVTGAKLDALTSEAAGLTRIDMTPKQSCDLELIANGGYSPLEGFMGQADFQAVCKDMTLADGTVWAIPILLAVDSANAPKVGDRCALYAPNGVLQGVIHVEEVYPHDKKLEIPTVFRTEDDAHPGAAKVMQEGDTCIAGSVDVVTLCVDPDGPEAFMDLRLRPAQTRAAFAERGWHTAVAFQTRNPIHRAHEYICKCAQEICDGLLIHPLVGETKAGDIPADIRMDSIAVLVEKYFNHETTMVSVLPAAMRYAGPREAIHHAIMRKNYGCSHFIVGRDHAGVGNYYGTYDAQKIFDDIDLQSLGITPLMFEHAGFSKSFGGMVTRKSFGWDNKDIVFLSGTKVREMLAAGEIPPGEFTRPEVAKVLMKWAQATS
ncbi:MAG: sulfate adenylyltransferase [Phycisphaerales bacterium]|nr:sulfate adenylyltransferase [Phycisphaerales bacterium]